MTNLSRFTEQQAHNADVARGWSEKRRLKVNAEDITVKVFTGGGLNDLTSGGTYTGIRGIIYKVVVTTAAGTDKFDWYKDGVSQATGVAMTGGAQTLDLGVTVTFGASTGHTLGDFWEFEATITTDRHKISDHSCMNLLISLDQKLWYRWAQSDAEPATVPITSAAVADGDGVQSPILPAGDSQVLRVPWGLLDTAGGNATGDLYLWIKKHTSDALMQVVEM